MHTLNFFSTFLCKHYVTYIVFNNIVTLNSPMFNIKYLFLLLLQLTVELYEILENVDKASEHMYMMNPISDFLYPLLISVT